MRAAISYQSAVEIAVGSREFAVLARRLRVCLGDLVRSIEHVGSTVAPGLAEKPIVNTDVITPGSFRWLSGDRAQQTPQCRGEIACNAQTVS